LSPGITIAIGNVALAPEAIVVVPHPDKVVFTVLVDVGHREAQGVALIAAGVSGECAVVERGPIDRCRFEVLTGSSGRASPNDLVQVDDIGRSMVNPDEVGSAIAVDLGETDPLVMAILVHEPGDEAPPAGILPAGGMGALAKLGVFE
jgi:hypothetical protein